MRLDDFREQLFDALNESDLLELADIETDWSNSHFLLTMKDGSVFQVACARAENAVLFD